LGVDAHLSPDELCEEVDYDHDHEKPFTNMHGGMCYQDPVTGKLGDEIYFVGIIDLLQHYNRRKKFETFFKSRMEDIQNISSVNPEMYSRRFYKFLEQIII